MNIEEDIFNNYKIDAKKLIKYGFKEKDDILEYNQDIMDGKFTVIITYNNKIIGKIIEKEFNEEYTNYRRSNLGEYSSKIKTAFINILEDIRNNCASIDIYKYAQTKKVCDYIYKKYNVKPEYLWDKYPSFGIYRKKQKWFLLLGSIEENKINKKTDSTKQIEFINVKVQSNLISELLGKKGYFEAYHMNKKHWITIVLDNNITDNEIYDMIDSSYNIV